MNKLIGLVVLLFACAVCFSSVPGCQKKADKDKEAKKDDTTKKDDTKKKDDVKKDDVKKDDVKKDDVKKDDVKKDDVKKDDVKKDDVKKDDKKGGREEARNGMQFLEVREVAVVEPVVGARRSRELTA